MCLAFLNVDAAVWIKPRTVDGKYECRRRPLEYAVKTVTVDRYVDSVHILSEYEVYAVVVRMCEKFF